MVRKLALGFLVNRPQKLVQCQRLKGDSGYPDLRRHAVTVGTDRHPLNLSTLVEGDAPRDGGIEFDQRRPQFVREEFPA